MWDQLAQWVIPRFVRHNDDFASIVAEVRQASCTMDAKVTSEALTAPLRGTIEYQWEDINDSGMLSGTELDVAVRYSSGPQMDPYMRGLASFLEDQTLLYFPFLFQVNDIKAVRISGGYKLRLRPAASATGNDVVDYDVAYLTITEDFRATEMVTESDKGVKATYRFKHRKRGDRWLAAGYMRRIVTPTARAEEDRTETYDIVQGVPLLKKVVIDTFVASASGAARATQTQDYTDWKVEKRDHTLIASGVRGEDVMQEPIPTPPTKQQYSLVKTLTGHGNLVLTVAWSPDGELVASGGMDKSIRIWDPEAGKCVKTFGGHQAPVNALAFTPDGKRLVSGSGEEAQNLRVWDVAAGKPIKAIESGLPVIFAVACSPNGSQIAVGGQGGGIAVFDAKTYEKAEPLAGHLFDVYALACTPPNPADQNAQALLVSGSADRTARVWKIEGTTWPGLPGENFGTFDTERQVAAVAAAWNGQRIAAGGTGNSIAVWDTTTGRRLHTLEGHRGWIEALDFAPVPGGALLLSGSRDRWIRLWDSEQGKCIQVLDDHEDTVRGVAFAPDGNRFASCGDDQTVRIYARGTPLPKPPQPPKTAKAPESGEKTAEKKE
jgi:hypothetical protein